MHSCMYFLLHSQEKITAEQALKTEELLKEQSTAIYVLYDQVSWLLT